MRSPMADDGFRRSLGEEPIWEGVWAHLDAMDTVCLRTVSMEWNCAGEVWARCAPVLLDSEEAGNCAEQ